ncbi:PolC-type DNA polymerase III [Desulfonispora thiosulfatigenes]|nr:PolC-type DNA polymerase III [Desulfonispora thiosulfatigenes]
MNFILSPKLEKNLSAREFIISNWDSLLEILGDKFPSTKGWLGTSNYDLKAENTIDIRFNSLLAIKYLQKNGCKVYLENFLANLIEEKFTINFKYDPSLKNEQSETQNIDELVAKSVEVNHIEIKPNISTRQGKINNTTKPTSKAVIMGKEIRQLERNIQEVTEEEPNIVIAGRPFAIEVKELKTGRAILSFSVTDLSDSLTCKVIQDGKLIAEIQEKLANSKKVKVKGTAQIDRYSQELVIMARDINTLKLDEREDLASEKRIELHLHTKFSSMDGISSAKDLIKQAAKWGHEAIAITDHGVVQAFPEAHDVGKANNIKVIYGMEGYIFDDINPNNANNQKKQNYHCIILVKTMEGLKNLYKLVTESHLNYFKRVPRIPKSLLNEMRTGLIIGSACEAGELIQSYLKDDDPERLINIAQFYDFIEIQPRGNNYFLLRNGQLEDKEQLTKLNTDLYNLGKKLDIPVVATGDVHFLHPEDETFRKIIMTGKGFSDADDQPPLYLKTTEEMLAEFSYLGETESKEVVIDNPKNISDQIEEIIPIPDEFYPPEIEGAEDDIYEMVYKKAHEWYGEELPSIVEARIKKEATAIIDNGFAVLYLTAHKLVKKSNEDGYLVGSRGSVGSSFVATLCGITEVNPLEPHYRCPECKYTEFITDGSVDSGADLPENKCPKCSSDFIKDGHNIPFEVFMGFKGDKVPDIDLNFSGEYQARAQKYTEELFGKDNVFRAGTISTIASRTAFGFVKNYLDDKNIVSRTAEIGRLVDGCTGIKRTTGQHPGGLMVIPKSVDVHMFTPLQRPADDVKSDIITTHFDYHSISSRLVKLDNLGHDDPTVIKILEDLTGVNAKTISLSEPKTMSLFCSTKALGITEEELGSPVGTYGIPEFGTKFVRQMLVDTKPTTFSELVRISGFSHGTDVWINNAQDLIKSGTAQLSEAISARDDIMIYLIQRGVESSTAFKIMEDVRKGRGVSPEFEQVLLENNIPKWYIESCKRIKYMFPKAHAVAYVMMAFRIAYFKVYYPLAFYTAFFTVRADEFDAELICKGVNSIRNEIKNLTDKGHSVSQKESKLLTIMEIALEMYLRGFDFQIVSLKKSDSKNFQIEGNTIIPPFAGLQGVGVQASLNIANARAEKYFTSIEDLRIRAKLSKTVIDNLREHGCLNELPETDQLSLFS